MLEMTEGNRVCLGLRRWVLVCAAAMLPGLAGAQAPAGAPPLPTGEDGLVQARQALEKAQWPEAERWARSYVAEHETSAEGHALLGEALFREDHPRESLNEYTHAAQLERPTALDLRCVALDYVLLADYKDADTWMSKSVEWNPNDGEAWYGLGRIKYSEHSFGEALENLQHALGLLPQSVKTENNIGLALEALNRPDEAVAAYRQAIAWQQESPTPSEQPLENLGVLLVDRYRLEEALPLLREAARIAPGESKVHAALGKLYERRGDLGAAQGELERAVALDAKSGSLHFQLGQVYRRQGEKTKAAAEFAQASALDGTHSNEAK